VVIRFAIVHHSPVDSGLNKPNGRTMVLDVARMLFFPALMGFAAATDLLTMTISNRVSLLLVAGFAILAPFSGMGLAEVGWHVAAGFTVLVVAFGCFALGWIGGGDAKIAAAAALWFGFDHLLEYLLFASIWGGLLTLAMLQFRQWSLPYALASQPWLQRLHDSHSGIPYGIALAIGALMVYPETDWIKAVDLARFAIH
jgi:prepilin peptidase CpaA